MIIKIPKRTLELIFFILVDAVACAQTKEATFNTSSLLQDNGNGTVTDLRTNFIWQKCSMGQVGDDSCEGKALPTNWLIAARYCDKLTLANKNWTLPTSQEFITLLSSGYNDSAVFHNTERNGHYWSATSHETFNLIGIALDMKEQRTNYKVKFDTNAVRCIVKHKVKKAEVNHHANWNRNH